MAKKATKTKQQQDVSLPKGLRKHIRRLKSEGRAAEAENLRKAALENLSKSE